MRVMHVIDSLAIGGAERMLVEIANATFAKGVSVSVCATRSLGPMADALDPNIRVISLDRRGTFDVARGLKIGQFVKSQGAHVLHVHGRTSLRFVSAVRSMGAVKVPVVFHDHHGAIDRDVSVPSWFPASARKHVAAYVGVCQALGDWAVTAGVPAVRIQVIPNALDLDRLRGVSHTELPWAHSHRPKRLGIVVAGLRPEKGIEELIRAMRTLDSSCDLGIVIVGGTRDANYVQGCHDLVQSFGLEDRFHFAGERTDATSLMAAADFGVISSLSESGPLTLIEMLAFGLPVVATKTGSIAMTAAARGLQGMVCPGDVAALAEELKRVDASSDDELRERGNLGKAIAESEFNIDQLVPKWLSVYEQAVS